MQDGTASQWTGYAQPLGLAWHGCPSHSTRTGRKKVPFFSDQSSSASTMHGREILWVIPCRFQDERPEFRVGRAPGLALGALRVGGLRVSSGRSSSDRSVDWETLESQSSLPLVLGHHPVGRASPASDPVIPSIQATLQLLPSWSAPLARAARCAVLGVQLPAASPSGFPGALGGVAVSRQLARAPRTGTQCKKLGPTFCSAQSYGPQLGQAQPTPQPFFGRTRQPVQVTFMS